MTLYFAIVVHIIYKMTALDEVAALQNGLWAPLGAYRRFPGKDCAAIKAAMFDNGNG